MKKFCESLREHAMTITNFKKKKMNPLTEEQQESYENAKKRCYICKENFETKYLKNKRYCKVRGHCHFTGEYRGTVHSIRTLKYSITKKNLIAFNSGPNYDYHFIIKETAEEELYLFRRKHCKIHNLYSSNRKKSYKN